jgi:Aerotolerance regulator N-terminal/von Willebrand factor type A domain
MYSFFANPWMLSALAAVTLPIIIEWLFRRRKRQVDLPTIRFLLRSKEQEKIRRQDRILLLLRMIGLFLLIFAISRPLIQHGMVGGARQRHIVVILDGTASSNQQVGVTTAFGLAQKKAAAMIRALPRGAMVTVVHLGDRVEVAVEQEHDLHTAAARVESLRASSGASPVSDALIWTRDYLAAQKEGEPEVYMFSDFQKYTWVRKGQQTSQVAQALNELSGKYDAFLVDTGGSPAYNYMVTGLAPREPLMSTGMPVRFLVRVEAWGTQPEGAKATVTFLVDGVKKDVREVRPGDGPAVLTFDHRFTKAGEYVVEALLGGDEHRVDNRRIYLCTVPESVQVLILDESAELAAAVAIPGAAPDADKQNPEDDLARESAYIARAIAPPSHPGMERVSRFATQTVHPSQLDYENLESYAAVVVTGIGSLTETMVAKLENYVSDGGALWFFLGERVNVYQYNKLLFKEGKGVLPCKLVTKVASAGNGESPHFSFGASGHQALSQLSGKGNTDAKVLSYMDLELAPGTRVVATFSNKKPAVLEKSFGRGNVLVTSTTAGVDWTYLPATVEFPVMVQELMRHLVGNPDRRVNLDVGDKFVQPVFVSQQHLLIRYPDGRKERLKPRKRTDRKDAYFVEFDRTNQQGTYEFVDVMPEVLPRARFAVNQLPEEGDLSRLTESDFKGAFGSGGWRWIGPERSVEDFVRKLHSVTEFAPYVLFLLVAILALESFLAARFGRRRAVDVDADVTEAEDASEEASQ